MSVREGVRSTQADAEDTFRDLLHLRIEGERLGFTVESTGDAYGSADESTANVGGAPLIRRRTSDDPEPMKER